MYMLYFVTYFTIYAPNFSIFLQLDNIISWIKPSQEVFDFFKKWVWPKVTNINIFNFTSVIDLHISFINTKRLPRTHLLVVSGAHMLFPWLQPYESWVIDLHHWHIFKSNNIADLHIYLSDTRRLLRTHMLLVPKTHIQVVVRYLRMNNKMIKRWKQESSITAIKYN